MEGNGGSFFFSISLFLSDEYEMRYTGNHGVMATIRGMQAHDQDAYDDSYGKTAKQKFDENQACCEEFEVLEELLPVNPPNPIPFENAQMEGKILLLHKV